MPESAATGDVYQIKTIGKFEGQVVMNVNYFSLSGSGDADVLTHLVLVWLQCFIDNILPVLPNGYSLEKAVWKKVSPTLGPEFESIPTGSTSGGGSGEWLPSFCAALISLSTTRPGRSGKGRMYIPGIPENASVESFLDPTEPYWAALLAFAACVVLNFIHPDGGVGTDSWDMMVYSRKIGGSALPYPGSGFAAVREVAPQRLIATQRSRKQGHGI